MKYVVVIERAKDGGYWAYLPDLPGCVSSGDTREEAERNIREAVDMHLESLRDHGEPVPQPAASVTTVDAA
jgi:predicted RNase H-like HicB family nuclease